MRYLLNAITSVDPGLLSAVAFVKTSDEHLNFATKKAKKSSRGHTCAQLFVTDKGFVHVAPMKSKKHVPQAMKEFAKVIGAPDSIITDAAQEETSAAIKAFCREIDTELRISERGTQWANRAEL